MDPYEQIAAFYDCEHAGLNEDIEFYRHIIREGPVLEVGVGTGRVMLGLIEAGFEVWGVDPSEAMLDRARQRLRSFPRTHLVQASIESVDLSIACRTAVFPLNTLWHFLDAEAQLQALHAARRLLTSGGLLLVDLSNPLTMADRGARGDVRERFNGDCNGTWLTVWSAVWDDEAEQLLDLSLNYDEVDAGTLRRTRSHLRLHYTYRFELELLLRSAGFRVGQIFGTYELDPYSSTSPNLIAVATAS